MESFQFSEKVNSIQPGIFSALNQKKNELLARERRVYNLSVGTPDFKPAPHIMKAMQMPAKIRRNINTHLPICRS